MRSHWATVTPSARSLENPWQARSKGLQSTRLHEKAYTCDELAEEHIYATCYPDPESAITEDGEIDIEAESTDCESGREARQSCLGTWRARRDLLDGEDASLALETCEEDTEYHQLIEDRDCDGMIHLLFGD